MLNISQKEEVALQLVLRFISVDELLKAAEDGFSQSDDVKSVENADLCFKAITSFLR